ncbi:hypothetical protein P3T39_007094 [Kitasatospora sp. GP82]|nr:hypothetical protein [Kitasatospora sp. GP82]
MLRWILYNLNGTTSDPSGWLQNLPDPDDEGPPTDS